MGRTSTPSEASSRAVPPVETISTPSSASPRAKSATPRLSDTVRSARRTRTSPALANSAPVGSVAPDILDPHQARVVGVGAHASGGYQLDGFRQQAMLDLVHAHLDRLHVARIGEFESLLQDDRPAVDALVDEVHGHPDQLHAVLQRLLDRACPRK